MAIKKTNPSKVTVNAGATVIVQAPNGDQTTIRCTGTNEKTGRTPKEVIKNLQDCIESAIKGETNKRKISTRK